MWTVDDERVAQRVAALSNGAICLFALVKQMDSGAPCLGADAAA